MITAVLYFNVLRFPNDNAKELLLNSLCSRVQCVFYSLAHWNVKTLDNNIFEIQVLSQLALSTFWFWGAPIFCILFFFTNSSTTLAQISTLPIKLNVIFILIVWMGFQMNWIKMYFSTFRLTVTYDLLDTRCVIFFFFYKSNM